MAEKVIIARHGDADAESPTWDLTEEGRKQIQTLAAAMLKYLSTPQPNTLIVSSWAARAQQTAELLRATLKATKTDETTLGNTNGVPGECKEIMRKLTLFLPKFQALILVTHSPIPSYLLPYFEADRTSLKIFSLYPSIGFPDLDTGQAYGIDLRTKAVVHLP